MNKNDRDAFLKTYLPERAWVTRIGENVYRLKLPEVVFKNAKTVKLKGWKRFIPVRVRIGLALNRIGNNLIASDWSKRQKPYSEIEDKMKENNESL